MKKRMVALAILAMLLLGAGTLLPPINVRSSAQPDAKGLALRAVSYLQKSRELADPSYLSRADSALTRSLDVEPDRNFEAFLGMALLANARHDFAGSVEWSKRAIAVNPHNASSYGALGDALFELGRYRAADRAYQDMIDIRPDVASYVRASYAYQFRGETRAAIAAMKLALEAAGPRGEDPAWIRHQLGDIYFGAGRLGRAAQQNRIGTRLAPGYVPPRVGLAEVDIGRGRLNRAIARMERAAIRLPSIEYLVTLADLYSATGQTDKARAGYGLALEKIRDHHRHGVGPDVDFVLFYADHDIELDETLVHARQMYVQRPTAPVADALAWTLYKLGRAEEAWPLARQAATSSPQDPAFALHAGSIASAVGRERAADAYWRVAKKAELLLSPVQKVELRTALRQRLSSALP